MKNLIHLAVIGVSSGVLLCGGIPQSVSWASEVAPEEPQLTQATTPEAPAVVLGQPGTRPYVVVIPTRRSELLERVQQHAPEAFLTRSRLGPYIQAGAFPRRSEAARLSRELRRQGLDARVAFRRVRTASPSSPPNQTTRSE